MGVATLLDPRSKTVLITYYYKNIYSNYYESGIKKVLNMCRRLFWEYQKRDLKQHVEEPIVRVKRPTIGFPKYYNMFAETMKTMRFDITTKLELYLEK